MTPPLVSVVMPVLNQQDYIRLAIDSILSQTLADFELIIIDDGSTDDTAQIIRTYIDKRIVTIKNEQNCGIAASLNRGIENARGKYIARMDADDISLPGRLKKQVDFMEANPEIGVLGSNAEVIDGKGNTKYSIKFPESHHLILWSFFFFDPIVHPSVMFRRDLVTQMGGYRDLRERTQDSFPEDYDLWTRLVQTTWFSNLADVLLKLRKHESGTTHVHLASVNKHSVSISQGYFEDFLGQPVPRETVEIFWKIDKSQSVASAAELLKLTYSHFLQKYPLSPDERAYIKKDVAHRLAKMALNHRQDPQSVELFFKSFQFHPITPLVDFGDTLRKKIKRHIRKFSE